MKISYIRLMFDYPCYPVWLYDEDGEVIDTDLPQEWKVDVYLDRLWLQLQTAYNSLFADNRQEFSYVGFQSDAEREDFDRLMHAAVNALYRINNGKYTIVNELKL